MFNRVKEQVAHVLKEWRSDHVTEPPIQYHIPGIDNLEALKKINLGNKKIEFWNEFDRQFKAISDRKSHNELINWLAERAPTYPDLEKALEILRHQEESWMVIDPETKYVRYTVPWDAESDDNPFGYELYSESKDG